MKTFFQSLPFLLMASTILQAQTDAEFLYISTYVKDKPENSLFVYRFDQSTGHLAHVASYAGFEKPSYMALSKDRQFLYACSEMDTPEKAVITAVKVDSKTGLLKVLNSVPSGGKGPVYVAIHPSGKYLVSGHYGSGSVSVSPLLEDGKIGEAIQTISFSGSSIHKDRQKKPHVHAAVFSNAGDFVFCPDLGSDKIHVLRFDPDSNQPFEVDETLEITTQPGSGPRHIIFSQNGSMAYCVEELSGMVSVYAYANGKLTAIERVKSYEKTQDSYGSADIHLSPDGKVLYTSNRWEDENTITIFAVDQVAGTLSPMGHQSTKGDHPRNFTLEPSGNYLLVANQKTNNVVVFLRDWETGLLEDTGVEIEVPAPVCLKFR